MDKDDRVYPTLGRIGINKDGPGRFQTEADKPDFQTCYFNLANDEQAYNEFVRKQINESESNDRIQFKIIHLKSKMNREENFDRTEELQDLTKNNGTTTSRTEKKRARTIFGQALNPLKSIMQDMERDLVLNQDFFLGENVDHDQNIIYSQKIIPKKIIKKRSKKNYSPTKVKSRNSLTSIF